VHLFPTKHIVIQTDLEAQPPENPSQVMLGSVGYVMIPFVGVIGSV